MEITPKKWETYLAQWKAEKADAEAAKAAGNHSFKIEKAQSGLERMGLTEDDSDRLTSVFFNTPAVHMDRMRRKYGFA